MNFYFAPLEGITGFTYRNAVAELFDGADKYYAPFISPSSNYRLKGKEIRDVLPENNNSDINLIPQILTNNGEYFIRAAQQLIELGFTEEININLGCPSGTVVAKKKGSGFLTELDEMDRFFDEIFEWRASQQRPVNISVKTRIGRYSPEEFPEILNIYNKYPISLVIVHPRTRDWMYKEAPNMEAFDYAMKNSKNPVCYNGEIRTVEDYRKIASGYDANGKSKFEASNETNDEIRGKVDAGMNTQINDKVDADVPDGVMIGRGLVANPNLIHEIKGGESLTKAQIKQYHDRLYKDFEEIMKSDKHLLFKMKEFWTYVSWNFQEEKKCAKLIHKCQNLYKYKQAVEQIFESMELKKQKSKENFCDTVGG